MVRYFLNIFLVFITLPYLYFAIRKLRKVIPTLPNAADLEGVEGDFQETKQLLFLGESAIAGVGVASNHQGLAGQISKVLSKTLAQNIHWEVLAHTGYDAEMVIDKLLPKLKYVSYDLILIQLAANDTFKLTPPVYFSLRMEKIINHLKQKYPNASILFLNNPPIKDMAFPPLVKFILGNIIDEHGKVIEHLIVQHEDLHFITDRLQFSDWQKRFPGKPKSEFFSDGVHPSAFTYLVWSHDIVDFIIDRKIINPNNDLIRR